MSGTVKMTVLVLSKASAFPCIKK